MTQPAVTAVICDDEPVKRRAVSEVLYNTGVELVVQTETLTALQRIVTTTPPTIIVLDLALAGMSGLEVVRDLRRACESCAIIVLSPFTALRADAMAAGARGLVDARDLRDLERLVASVAKARQIDVDPKTIRLDEAPLPADQPGT